MFRCQRTYKCRLNEVFFKKNFNSLVFVHTSLYSNVAVYVYLQKLLLLLFVLLWYVLLCKCFSFILKIFHVFSTLVRERSNAEVTIMLRAAGFKKGKKERRKNKIGDLIMSTTRTHLKTPKKYVSQAHSKQKRAKTFKGLYAPPPTYMYVCTHTYGMVHDILERN